MTSSQCAGGPEHGGGGVDRRAQQHHQPADVRERQRAQPALVAGPAPARPPSRARWPRVGAVSSTGRGAPVVPEVWTTNATGARGAPTRLPADRLRDPALGELARRARSPPAAGRPASRRRRPAGRRAARPRSRAPARRTAARARPDAGLRRPAAPRARALQQLGVGRAARRRPRTRRGRGAARRRATSQGSGAWRARLTRAPMSSVTWTSAGEFSDIRYELVRRRHRQDHDRPAGGAQRVPARDADRDLGRARAAREDPASA